MQSILFYCKITTCFGCPPRPSSGVHKSVITASGTTQHNVHSYSLYYLLVFQSILVCLQEMKLTTEACKMGKHVVCCVHAV
jgi:hypothetical protein